MELKVGMYVRYIPTLGIYTQKISKITKVKNCLLDMAYYLDNLEEPVFSSHFDDIVKTSDNIIDLIEEGDYVNGVEVIGKEFDNFNKEYLQCGVGDYVICTFEVKDIKTILTKEQFESQKYIVESE